MTPFCKKIIPILKLPHFLPHRIGGEKVRQFQSWSRSYIVLALARYDHARHLYTYTAYKDKTMVPYLPDL